MSIAKDLTNPTDQPITSKTPYVKNRGKCVSKKHIYVSHIASKRSETAKTRVKNDRRNTTLYDPPKPQCNFLSRKNK